MNATATTTQPRVIGKCRNGHTVNTTLENYRGGWVECPCGSSAVAKFMNIKFVADKNCSDKCTGATGPVCSCSCGGENHGGQHTFS